MSSSGPGCLPYVSKIELICRLVRRWHSTPLLNTSITRRAEIHSGEAPERNESATEGDEIARQLLDTRERECVQLHVSSSPLLSDYGEYFFDEQTFDLRRSAYSARPESFRSPQTRLCRRHEQQSQAEPLNAEIRSGAENGAEIETDRER